MKENSSIPLVPPIAPRSDWKRLLKNMLSPVGQWQRFSRRRKRKQFDSSISRLGDSADRGFVGPFVVDGLFDNPNYWARFAFASNAFGLRPEQGIGLLGPFQVSPVMLTLRRLKIRKLFSFDRGLRAGEFYRSCQQEASLSIRGVKTAADLLKIKLPYDFPPEFLYDAILKEERVATVNPDSPAVVSLLAECIGYLYQTEALIREHGPEIFFMSHVISHRMGAIAWVALKHSIPVYLLFGNYGTFRFTRIMSPDEIFDTTDRPNASEIENLSPQVREQLIAATRQYMAIRERGESGDIGARYAFARNNEVWEKESLCSEYGWDLDKPIISVYASNWFDYPHAFGLKNFVDFLEWIQVTIRAIRENRAVNWLLKPHPCDEWYGGVTLKDLVEEHPDYPHIRLCPQRMSAKATKSVSDGLVTVHGTAAIEFALDGKPTLLADRGWYHTAGIGRVCNSQSEYVEQLTASWYKDFDSNALIQRAEIFAGIYFTPVSWQNGLLFLDDSEQWKIFDHLPDLLKKHPVAIRNEIRAIQDWKSSGHPYLHTFKHINSGNATSPNC